MTNEAKKFENCSHFNDHQKNIIIFSIGRNALMTQCQSRTDSKPEPYGWSLITNDSNSNVATKPGSKIRKERRECCQWNKGTEADSPREKSWPAWPRKKVWPPNSSAEQQRQCRWCLTAILLHCRSHSYNWQRRWELSMLCGKNLSHIEIEAFQAGPTLLFFNCGKNRQVDAIDCTNFLFFSPFFTSTV